MTEDWSQQANAERRGDDPDHYLDVVVRTKPLSSRKLICTSPERHAALLAVVEAVKEWRAIPAGTVHELEVMAAMLRIFDAMDALETVDKRDQA